MITFEKFKELFESLDKNKTTEIEIYFYNEESNYIIVKHKDYITFSKCEIHNIKNKVIKYSNLNELYNSITLNNICLKKDWDKIQDILIDNTFSVVEDKEQIKQIYNVQL